MAKKQKDPMRKFFLYVAPIDVEQAAMVALTFVKVYGDIDPFKKVVMDKRFLAGNTRRGNVVVTYK